MLSINQQAILALLFAHPQTSYYLHEIGRILGKKPGVFQKALNSLEEQGMVVSQRRGNQRVVSLNPRYPLRQELKRMIQKTAGVEGRLTSLVNGEPQIQTAFLFGSYVTNRMQSHSDIDLILIGARDAEDKMLEGIEQIEKFIQREINPKFYTVEEYTKKKREADPFLTDILGKATLILKGKP